MSLRRFKNFKTIYPRSFDLGGIKRCVCETWMPRRQLSPYKANKLISYIFYPTQPIKAVKRDKIISELTVQGWLLCHHLNFKY